ncbi:MAG TPA: ATP-binding protein [Planktothrix sp.]|jgi:predicted kinase
MKLKRAKLLELLRTNILRRFSKLSAEAEEHAEPGDEQPAFETSRSELVRLLSQGAASRFIQLVGAQGSGKSTLAKHLRSQGGFSRLSMDKVLKHEPYLAYTPELLAERFYQLIKEALQRGENICDDNLNCSRSARSKSLRLAREAGYTDIVIIHLDMPLEHCLRQNRKRVKEAPDEVLRRAWQRLQEEPVHKPKVGELIRLRPAEKEGYFLVSLVD